MKKRDQLESDGFGDQLMEMQEVPCPVKRVCKRGFRIDVCYEYMDDSQQMLQWCQGRVKKLIKHDETRKCLLLEIEWDEKCVAPGESNVTVEKLMINRWNPETHQKGSWREDLHHSINHYYCTTTKV